jgi:hypothetical protein
VYVVSHNNRPISCDTTNNPEKKKKRMGESIAVLEYNLIANLSEPLIAAANNGNNNGGGNGGDGSVGNSGNAGDGGGCDAPAPLTSIRFLELMYAGT